MRICSSPPPSYAHVFDSRAIAHPHINDQLRTVQAISLDHYFLYESKGEVTGLYASKPDIRALDYKLIRDLSEWTGASDRLSVDIRYYVCRDDSGQVVPAETVIGKPGVTLSMHIPRVALYSTFWKMKNRGKTHGIVATLRYIRITAEGATKTHIKSARMS